MSACLPGVSVPIFESRALARAVDRRELDDLFHGQQLRQVLLAGALAREDLHALQREARAHLVEEIARHLGFDVDAQARADAVRDRLLERRNAVTHFHFDRP